MKKFALLLLLMIMGATEVMAQTSFIIQSENVSITDTFSEKWQDKLAKCLHKKSTYDKYRIVYAGRKMSVVTPIENHVMVIGSKVELPKHVVDAMKCVKEADTIK